MSMFGTDSVAASSSAHQETLTCGARPNTSPKYPNSTMARCFTTPNRLVPVGVIGRRRS